MGSLEDLDPVPVDVDNVDGRLTRSDIKDGLPGQLVYGSASASRRDVVLADGDATIWRDADNTEVEKDVVQRAQRERIGYLVWPAAAMPVDVRGLDRDWVAAKLAVEAAHGALIGVGTQYCLGEAACPGPAGRDRSTACLGRLQGGQIEADLIADHPFKGWREMQV